MNLWHDPRALHAIANGLVMLAFACLLLAGLWWLGQRPVFDLLAIEVGPVNGRRLDHVDERKMMAQGVNRLDGNFFTVGLDRVREHFEQVPWVRRAEVRRIWPNRLFVALEEHQVLARWKDDGGRFVNTHGELFAVNPAEVAHHQDLLLLSGPTGSQALVARRYDERYRLRDLQLNPILIANEIACLLRFSIDKSFLIFYQLLHKAARLRAEMGRQKNIQPNILRLHISDQIYLFHSTHSFGTSIFASRYAPRSHRPTVARFSTQYYSL